MGSKKDSQPLDAVVGAKARDENNGRPAIPQKNAPLIISDYPAAPEKSYLLFVRLRFGGSVPPSSNGVLDTLSSIAVTVVKEISSLVNKLKSYPIDEPRDHFHRPNHH